METFFGEIGERVGRTGEQIKHLFKNLSAEYQKVKQRLHISGVETDGEPMLRNSTELYWAFDEYYHLFFLRGAALFLSWC